MEAESNAGQRMAVLTMCAEYVTTPPLPLSSSPGDMDMMDMSPLPHKAPFSFATEIEVPSPSPIPPQSDDMAVGSPPSRQLSLEPPKPIGAE